MRSNFTIQPELGILPIEKIQISTKSRDKRKRGYERCVGLGVLAYNLHQIGNGLQRQAKEAREKAERKKARAERRAAA